MKINNEEEYDKAMLEVDDLIDAPEHDLKAMARLDELSAAAEEYEEEHYPVDDATDEEVIAFLAESNKISITEAEKIWKDINTKTY